MKHTEHCLDMQRRGYGCVCGVQPVVAASMKTYMTNAAACPACGYKVDRATFALSVPVAGPANPPAAGDVSICFNCSAVNIFVDAAGHLRRPTLQEQRRIRHNKRLQKLVRDLKAIDKVSSDDK